MVSPLPPYNSSFQKHAYGSTMTRSLNADTTPPICEAVMPIHMMRAPRLSHANQSFLATGVRGSSARTRHAVPATINSGKMARRSPSGKVMAYQGEGSRFEVRGSGFWRSTFEVRGSGSANFERRTSNGSLRTSHLAPRTCHVPLVRPSDLRFDASARVEGTGRGRSRIPRQPAELESPF